MHSKRMTLFAMKRCMCLQHCAALRRGDPRGIVPLAINPTERQSVGITSSCDLVILIEIKE